jgi:hypothetical protein
MELTIDLLQKLCNDGRIRWTEHVLLRLLQRGIARDDVKAAIRSGTIIEHYPDDYPYPSCLVFGFTVNGRVMHAVCGVGHDELVVITAYYPNPDEWEHDLRKRRA